MSDLGSKPDAAGANRPEFDIWRSRRFDRVVLTVTLMVIGWYVGRGVSSSFSDSLIVDTVLCGLFTGAGAAVAAYLANRLALFDPDNALILRVAADGITLGYPTHLSLSWGDIDQVRFIRPSGGQLPLSHLQVIRRAPTNPNEPSPEIMHQLGLLWDRRAAELLDALYAFTAHGRQTEHGENNEYSAGNWTGSRDHSASP